MLRSTTIHKTRFAFPTFEVTTVSRSIWLPDLAGWPHGGRKFLYKNKRSGERDSTKIVINMEEFVKTVFSFQYGPDDVFGGSGYLFDISKEGGYVRLFGNDGEVPPSLTEHQ